MNTGCNLLVCSFLYYPGGNCPRAIKARFVYGHELVWMVPKGDAYKQFSKCCSGVVKSRWQSWATSCGWSISGINRPIWTCTLWSVKTLSCAMAVREVDQGMSRKTTFSFIVDGTDKSPYPPSGDGHSTARSLLYDDDKAPTIDSSGNSGASLPKNTIGEECCNCCKWRARANASVSNSPKCELSRSVEDCIGSKSQWAWDAGIWMSSSRLCICSSPYWLGGAYNNIFRTFCNSDYTQ